MTSLPSEAAISSRRRKISWSEPGLAWVVGLLGCSLGEYLEL